MVHRHLWYKFVTLFHHLLSHCTPNSNSSKPPSVSSESFTVDWPFHYCHWPLSSSISSTHSCSFTHYFSLSFNTQFSSAWPKAVMQTQKHQHVINHGYPFNLQPQPLVLSSSCTILPSSRIKWLPCWSLNDWQTFVSPCQLLSKKNAFQICF